MAITFSTMTKRLAETRGQLAAATHRRLVRETLERGRPVAYRAAPLDFSDIADRLERALSAAH